MADPVLLQSEPGESSNRNVQQNCPSLFYKAAEFKNERATYERVEKFISRNHFTDCNLYGRLYDQCLPVTVKHLFFGEEKVPFSVALEQLSSQGSTFLGLLSESYNFRRELTEQRC